MIRKVTTLVAVAVLATLASNASAQTAEYDANTGRISFRGLTGQQILVIESASGGLMGGVADSLGATLDETGIPDNISWVFGVPADGDHDPGDIGMTGLPADDITFSYVNNLFTDPTQRTGDLTYIPIVPEPGTVALAGLGLIGLGLIGRRRS